MPEPLIAAMPPELDLPDGYIVRFNALDPVTGNAVSGVVVKNVSIFGTLLTPEAFAVGTYKPVLLKAGSTG